MDEDNGCEICDAEERDGESLSTEVQAGGGFGLSVFGRRSSAFCAVCRC
jgi:hypothetical protein